MQMLKKADTSEWIADCDTALAGIKHAHSQVNSTCFSLMTQKGLFKSGKAS